MATQDNPDFSLDAKKKIAKATRLVLGEPADYTNTTRPAFPRSGGGGKLPTPQYAGMVWQGVANNEGGFDYPRAFPGVG